MHISHWSISSPSSRFCQVKVRKSINIDRLVRHVLANGLFYDEQTLLVLA